MPEIPRRPAARTLVVARTVYASRADGGWLVHEAHGGARLPAVPLVEACLDACVTPISRAALRRRLHPWPADASTRAIDALEAAGLLVDAREQQHDSWAPWAPVAEWFHHATRDVPIRKGRARQEPPPPAIRRRRGISLALPSPAIPDGTLRDALLERRTWRRFAKTPMSRQELATLLGLTFGVQAWAEAPGAGPSALKTSPSGGARHSLEAYLAIRRVADVPAGLYHYRPDTHRLVRLRDGCNGRDLARYLPGQPGYRAAAVTCFLSSELARVRWRYPHARAYRVVLIEAGHLAQTFALVATALGLAPFTTGALAESHIEDAFGLSAWTSPVVYACGAGRRPAALEWAPYADAPAPPRTWTRLSRQTRGPRS